MQLAFTAEEKAFRDEVRAFLRDHLPRDIAARVDAGGHLTKEDCGRWHRILHQQGWVAPNWPKEHGGTGWTPTQRWIFEEECAAHDAPRTSPFGLAMVGPVIYTFGNEAQKQLYLPRILAAEDWWCQGYSEPGSGSDLASLKTSAVRDGDRYIVNGHKIWTTEAHWANLMFCLVRTDPKAKPQQGISFVLIDMNQPGVTVKPIVTIDEGHNINEVFLDNVVVPVENLVGEEGKGWTYAKFLLGNERVGIAAIGHSKRRLNRLKQIARRAPAGLHPLVEDADFRRRLTDIEIELMALEVTSLRVLSDEQSGRGVGPEASLLKIRGAEITQWINELAVVALGHYAMAYEPPVPGSNQPPLGPENGSGLIAEHLYLRATTIYGGSNEIQRNVIAKAVLGL